MMNVLNVALEKTLEEETEYGECCLFRELM